MIVYKNNQNIKSTAMCLAEIEHTIDRLAKSDPVRHEDAVNLLTGFGEFETAAVDLLSRDPRCRSACALLRRIGILTGHVFCCSWEGSGHVRLWLRFLKKDFAHTAALPLPTALAYRVPEGYAAYNLYPETHLEAARKFYREASPDQVICIGLRSIATSLSSVVSATLENLGCRTASFTVRPEGPPYQRRVKFGPQLDSSLRDMDDPFFVLVDEGPGLSGASLCGTAQKLSDRGIADDRIVFVPGHQTDGASFLSEAVRGRWRRHRHYTVDFEEVWIHNKRLLQSLPVGQVADLSGERWRTFFSESCKTPPPSEPVMSGAGMSSAHKTAP